ncbi:very long chain fatty acid elongase 6-like [Mytilus galloprovincialis]|uniref:Elongation of very long chain fatty acids protein n=2 Tax=Mytilus TaxID=6548 RepID=A0A8B6BXL8_MYTGA|nr:ELOVL6 [Mytilus edulis]VDH97125.1 elongation of very long chain fatty acids protein 6 [Mytilus galloprovincialis]
MGAHNYSYVFDFEEQFNENEFNRYMREHWSDSFIYSAVYLIIIFGGKHVMSNRRRFDLRPYLATWSGGLAIFSIFGAIRTVPEIISAIKNHSLEYSICVPSYFEGVTSFWCFLFTVSKVLELGDTLFIVLRKQPLIFLHWFHHITVLIYVWYTYPQKMASGRWFMTMNYTVHSLMYSYYALRAMRVNIPKWVNMGITFLQLLQMIMGLLINILAYRVLDQGSYCAHSYTNIRYSVLMYCSYFVLFAHFFYTTYVVQKPKQHVKDQ